MYFEKFVSIKSHSEQLSLGVNEEMGTREGRRGEKYKTNADSNKNRIERGNMLGGG